MAQLESAITTAPPHTAEGATIAAPLRGLAARVAGPTEASDVSSATAEELLGIPDDELRLQRVSGTGPEAVRNSVRRRARSPWPK